MRATWLNLTLVVKARRYEYNNSTVWDDTFETDSAALTEATKTVLAEGVGSLFNPEDGKSNGEWK